MTIFFLVNIMLLSLSIPGALVGENKNENTFLQNLPCPVEGVFYFSVKNILSALKPSFLKDQS